LFRVYRNRKREEVISLQT